MRPIEKDVALAMLPTIDPIHAAGGCYCRECKHCKGADNNPALTCGLNSVGIQTGLAFITPDDFCSYGEPREAQTMNLPDWHYPLYTAARDVADSLVSMECALLNDHEDQAEHYREELPARVDRLHKVLREVHGNIHDEGGGACDFCGTAHTDWSAGGAHDFRLDGDTLYCFDSSLGWEGVKVHFCPMCGRKLNCQERGGEDA